MPNSRNLRIQTGFESYLGGTIMSVVTLIGAGQMASALTFPLFEN